MKKIRVMVFPGAHNQPLYLMSEIEITPDALEKLNQVVGFIWLKGRDPNKLIYPFMKKY